MGTREDERRAPVSRIERERSYAELQDTLLGPETLAAKLTELARFVGAERDDALLEPYLVETVDLLIRLLAPGGHGPLELTGLAPADIEPLYRRLESMEASATLKSSLDRAVESCAKCWASSTRGSKIRMLSASCSAWRPQNMGMRTVTRHPPRSA